jgi:hypothetical protein
MAEGNAWGTLIGAMLGVALATYQVIKSLLNESK